MHAFHDMPHTCIYIILYTPLLLHAFMICLHLYITYVIGAFGKVYSGNMESEGTRTVVAIKTIKSKEVTINIYTC